MPSPGAASPCRTGSGTAAGRRLGLCGGFRVHQLDMGGEAAEVPDIEGQKAPLAMRQHGGDDVGVMHLLAAHRYVAAEPCQRAMTCGPSSSTSYVSSIHERSASAIAIGKGADHACGRVAAARYSRMIWRLMRRTSPDRSARFSAALARAWAGAASNRAGMKRLVSRNTRVSSRIRNRPPARRSTGPCRHRSVRGLP